MLLPFKRGQPMETTPLNTLQTEIGSYIGRLLRDNFGKGPESIYVSLGSNFITMYLRNFISPPERVLMGQSQEFTVQRTRDILMQALIPEIKAYIKMATGNEIVEFYHDWALHNRSGLFAGVTAKKFPNEHPFTENYSGREVLEQEIVAISEQAQKKPAELYSIQLNPRTLLVIRNGILVNIEKELIRLGFKETLVVAKRNLEKNLLHNNNHFEKILEMKTIDIFVDWDFEIDKSVIVFITNPTAKFGGNALDIH